jgi:hypothetical protein
VAGESQEAASGMKSGAAAVPFGDGLSTLDNLHIRLHIHDIAMGEHNQ